MQTERAERLQREKTEYQKQIEEMIKSVDKADMSAKLQQDEVDQIRAEYD